MHDYIRVIYYKCTYLYITRFLIFSLLTPYTLHKIFLLKNSMVMRRTMSYISRCIQLLLNSQCYSVDDIFLALTQVIFKYPQRTLTFGGLR